MPESAQLERVLWFVTIALTVVLAARILISRLEASYPCFEIFLCVNIAQSAACLPFAPGSNAYSWVFRISQPVIWVLYILVVLELYTLVLQKHQGVATAGRWTLLGALPVSIGISLLTMIPDLNAPPRQYPILYYYDLIERGLMSSLVIFLLLIAGFLLWYPVPLNRNVVLHAVVYAVYFLSSTMTLFIGNVRGDKFRVAVSTTLLAIANVCLLVWIIFLNRRGEERMVVLRHHLPKQDADRLLEQLESINSALIRARK